MGILPKSGPLEVWIQRVQDLRKRYEEIVESQRVFFIQKVNIDHLDPLIFNPLSQATEVIFK